MPAVAKRIVDLLDPGLTSSNANLSDRISLTLQVIRSHLGMDIAFVSRFENGRRYFLNVEGYGNSLPIRVGGSDPLEDSYCQRIVDGRLPELMHNAAAVPEAAALPVTGALPVGAHLSVPIRLTDGRVYGTFCCFSHRPDPSLNERDLQMVKAFAELTRNAIEEDLTLRKDQDDKAERIRRVIETDELSIVCQPIFSLEAGRIVAVEALSRFSGTPRQGPDVWFAEAAEVGLGTALERLAIKKAVAQLPAMAEGIYLTFNASPATVLSGALQNDLRRMPLERLGVEITEHASISDYSDLKRALQPLRRRGLKLAVDDVGAGYSSMRHILELKPDLIKLDVGLVRAINRDPDRRALASALIAFSRQTGCRIVAEGVETTEELRVLKKLGVDKVQGYLLGRPAVMSEETMRDWTSQRIRSSSALPAAKRSA